jgi:hypothetical protein
VSSSVNWWFISVNPRTCTNFSTLWNDAWADLRAPSHSMHLSRRDSMVVWQLRGRSNTDQSLPCIA